AILEVLIIPIEIRPRRAIGDELSSDQIELDVAGAFARIAQLRTEAPGFPPLFRLDVVVQHPAVDQERHLPLGHERTRAYRGLQRNEAQGFLDTALTCGVDRFQVLARQPQWVGCDSLFVGLVGEDQKIVLIRWRLRFGDLGSLLTYLLLFLGAALGWD